MEMLEHVNKFHSSNERIATRQCGTLRLISHTQITSPHAYVFLPPAFARISKEQFNRVSELWREQATTRIHRPTNADKTTRYDSNRDQRVFAN